MFDKITKRNLVKYEVNANIHSEYADSPNHRLVARIDVDGSTDIGAMDDSNYTPYTFTLTIDDVVVACFSYHHVVNAIQRWDTLADIFGYPYVDYDGYTLHVADSPDEPVPAA